MRFGPAMTVLAAAQTTINVTNSVISESIYAAVSSVHRSCQVNTDMLTHYHGGELPTVRINDKPVLLTFGAIHNAQMSLLTDGQMTPDLTLESTEYTVGHVLETLQFSVPGTVVALVEKKSELQAAGLVDTVRNSLELLLHNHKIAGQAIAPRFHRGNKALMAAMKKQGKEVTEKIEDGIRSFEAC